MENKSPWYLPQQYLTKRWQKLHPSHLNPPLINTSFMNVNSTRPFRNNRYLTTSAMTNSRSCPRFKVQEVCLQDNKWFIIDSYSDVLRPLANKVDFQQLRNKKYRQGYFPKVTKTSKSQLLKTQTSKERIDVGRCTGKKKKQNTQILQGQQQFKSNIDLQKVGFKKSEKTIKKLKLKFKEQQGNHLSEVAINVEENKVIEIEKKLDNSSVKRLQPPKLRQGSPKSVKSAKSMKSAKSVNKKHQIPLKKLNNTSSQEQQIKVKVVPESLPEEVQPTYSEKTQIMKLFDPSNLLLGHKGLDFLMENPYNDFPEWGSNQMINPLNLMESDFPINHFEENAFERKKSLPYDFASSILLSKNNYDNQTKQQGKSKTSICLIAKDQNVPKRYTSMIASVERGEVKAQFSMKERCLTTKVTDKPPDSPHIEALQGFEFNPSLVKQEKKENSSSSVFLKEKQVLDQSFNVKTIFLPEEDINFIQIKITKQTAYFPWNLTKPIYIAPNPSSSLYQNKEIIDLLNLLLKVQPNYLSNMFNHFEEQFYQCSLFIEGRKEEILVDGLFPFDSNYFSLFGSVEQYIWFSVLMKAIAKKKGSYISLSSLNFKEMFSLITNLELVEVNHFLKNSNDPLYLLESLLRQTKQMETLLLVIEQNKFYKVDSIFYKKSASQRKEEKEEELELKKAKIQKYLKKQVNMKSLSMFIKEQKSHISIQRMKQNTIVRLVSIEERKNVSLGELITQNYLIFQPKTSFTQQL